MVEKKIELTEMEERMIATISGKEHIPEGIFLRKLILDGLDKYRIKEAIRMYKRGEVTLDEASEVAGIRVREMMRELEVRGISLNMTFEMERESLKLLADVFGNKELKRALGGILPGQRKQG